MSGFLGNRPNYIYEPPPPERLKFATAPRQVTRIASADRRKHGLKSGKPFAKTA